MSDKWKGVIIDNEGKIEEPGQGRTHGGRNRILIKSENLIVK